MSKKKHVDKSQNQVIMAFGAAILVMMGITIGSMMNDSGNPPAPASKTEFTPIYTNAVIDIANEFLCSCGSCDEPNLDACVCPTAKEEKNTINDLLNRGYDRAKVIQTIEATYGGRKT